MIPRRRPTSAVSVASLGRYAATTRAKGSESRCASTNPKLLTDPPPQRRRHHVERRRHSRRLAGAVVGFEEQVMNGQRQECQLRRLTWDRAGGKFAGVVTQETR